MANDLDLYSGGDLAPYSPGGVDLFQTDAESHWGDLTPDYLSTPGQQVQLQDPQVQANIQQIASVFENDMASLGFVNQEIQACIGFFKSMLANPPTRMPAKRHAYPMWQFSHDIQFMAFCNFAATQRFAPELIQSVAYWLGELEHFQHGTGRFAGQHVQAPTTSSDPLDSLSNADYDRVVLANERAAASTMGRLKDLWGQSFAGNMRVVQQHFASLTPAEQEHLNQYTTGWIRGTNTFEIVTSLYAQAVHAHTIPRDGASIERELQKITQYMKNNRAAYLKDEATQARFRELINLQSGGR